MRTKDITRIQSFPENLTLKIYILLDNQMPWRYISSIADQQRKKGRMVREKMFSSSGHVAHLKIHPEEYKQTISNFLDTVRK